MSERINETSFPPLTLEDIYPDSEVLQNESAERVRAQFPDMREWSRQAIKPHGAFRPGGALFRETVAFCTTEHTDFVAVDNLSSKITRILNKKHNQTPVERVMTYSSVYAGIQKLSRTECDNSDISYQNINLIVGDAAERSLETIKDPDELYQIWAVSELFSGAAANQKLTSFAAKFTSFADKAVSQGLVRRYFETQAKRNRNDYHVEYCDEDSNTLQNMFAELYRTRTYDIKPAYINDEDGGSIIFDEVASPRAYVSSTQYISPLMLAPTTIAEIVHNSEPDPSDLHYSVTEHYGGYTGRQYDNLNPLIHAHLGVDGELYEDRIGRKPYLRLVKDNDALYGAYRAFQLTILSHFHDLTRALDATGEPVEDTTKSVLRRINTGRDIHNTIGSLTIPRQKHNTEIDPSLVDSPSKRPTREHDIGPFKRTLPNGWKASPTARALAKELNMELAENETVVRRHKRGSTELGRISLHKIMER